MRPPVTPLYPMRSSARRLSPRAAVMVGLAGIMVAAAVIGASHSPAGTPATRATAPVAAPVAAPSSPAAPPALP